MNNTPLNKIPSSLPIPNRIGSGKAINKPVKGMSFHDILREKQSGITSELKFSKHANERLASRNIDLTDDQYRRLETGARRLMRRELRNHW